VTEVDISMIEIKGFQGKPVPNKYFRHPEQTATLAVIFPGLNYTCDMPLLYYLHQLLIERGADVLQLHTNYTTADFQSLPAEGRFAWMAADAEAAIERMLALSRYQSLIWVGKSIGTLALAYLASLNIPLPYLSIWLTPLLRQPFLVEQASQLSSPSLFIASQEDRTYDEKAMQYIQRKSPFCEAFILTAGDHRLELAGNPRASLLALADILEREEAFLNKHAKEGSELA